MTFLAKPDPIATAAADDARLVTLCLGGDRAAFGRIVERYQALICSLAYAACGDFHHSEELAQETFLAAWRQLRALREPDKLKSWLCGITRHLAHDSLRQRRRTPTAEAEPLDEEAHASRTSSPRERVIDREEKALLWTALETLPLNYREPMVLFYRQQESVAAVAHALELSEETVRQRLARGRVLLAGQIEQVLRTALHRSAPGKTFTLTVLAALPLSLHSAKAAAAGAMAVKGGAAAKGALGLGLLGALAPPLAAVAGVYYERRLAREEADPEMERVLKEHFHLLTALAGLGIVAVILVTGFTSEVILRSFPNALGASMIALLVVVLFSLGVSLFRLDRKLRQTLAVRAALLPAPAAPRRLAASWEYRSRRTLLGLPLVHICLGERRPPVVKAWVAVGGQMSCGVLFAMGGVAISGGVSLGGVAVGALGLGGVAVGVLALGGMAAGVGAVGGLALGWVAGGGSAIAWKAAVGGLAVAHEFALGGGTVAPHGNDAAARAFAQSDAFYRQVRFLLDHAVWVNLMYLPMAVVYWWRLHVLRTARQAKS